MMFDRWRYKRRIMREPLPEVWLEWIEASVAQWRYLDDDERTQLLDDVRSLVADKYWEAANGFALTDEMRVCIAAQAALLVLGLDDDDPFRNVTSIVVHPSTITLPQTHHGPGMLRSDGFVKLYGVTQESGPVVIAWDEAQRNARHPEKGHNVVYHEFAHKLDMLDGLADGTPPLESREVAERWVDVCTREFSILQEDPHGSILDGYGATNVAEFFAVATEVFFDTPVALEQLKPELYESLREAYHQDPAERVRTRDARTDTDRLDTSGP